MPTSTIAIGTPRLLLEYLDIEKHLEGLHAIYSNETAMKWMPTYKSDSLDETKFMLEKELKSPDRPWIHVFAILLRPTEEKSEQKPRVIGKIGTTPNIACYIHPDYWGKGYATEAGKACLEYFWTIPEFRHQQKLTSAIDTQNLPSLKLARRISFHEGETYGKVTRVGEVTMFHAFRGDILIPGLVHDIRPLAEERFPIKTERLWMQHLNIEDHLQGYYEVWKQPENRRFNPKISDPLTIENSRRHLTSRVRSETNPYVQKFAIFAAPVDKDSPNPNSRLMGTVGMHRFPETFKAMNAEPGEPEVGFGLHPDFWGKGYATEALKGFLGYYWNIREAPHVSVKSIVACFAADNSASGRVLERVGFQLFGTAKEKIVMMDGSEMESRITKIQRPSFRT